MEFSAAEQEQLAADEDVMTISKQLIAETEAHRACAMKECWTLH